MFRILSNRSALAALILSLACAIAPVSAQSERSAARRPVGTLQEPSEIQQGLAAKRDTDIANGVPEKQPRISRMNADATSLCDKLCAASEIVLERKSRHFLGHARL
jgi:hypothetical protein